MMIRILSLLAIVAITANTSAAQWRTFYKATGRYECENDPATISGPMDEFGEDCEVLHTSIMQKLDPPLCYDDPYIYVDMGCIEAMGGTYPLMYGVCTVKWINTYQNGKVGVERIARTEADARAQVHAVSLEWQTRCVEGTVLGNLLSSEETVSCVFAAAPCRVYCPPTCCTPVQACLPRYACPETYRVECCVPIRCGTPQRTRCRLFGRFRR